MTGPHLFLGAEHRAGNNTGVLVKERCSDNAVDRRSTRRACHRLVHDMEEFDHASKTSMGDRSVRGVGGDPETEPVFHVKRPPVIAREGGVHGVVTCLMRGIADGGDATTVFHVKHAPESPTSRKRSSPGTSRPMR